MGGSTMTLTNVELIKAIIKEMGCTRIKSSNLVEILLEIIKNRLESGEDVLISGFGKFCVMEKAARRGRNPATGDSLTLLPRKVVVFRCSENLRAKINSIG